MASSRHTLSPLRALTVWLLAASAFLGPMGPCASSMLAALKTCGASCPCEDTAHDEPLVAAAPELEAPAPALNADFSQLTLRTKRSCEDPCPDDCPRCSCCPGRSLAVLGLELRSTSLSPIVLRFLTPPEDAARGASEGVFRPPRLLA